VGITNLWRKEESRSEFISDQSRVIKPLSPPSYLSASPGRRYDSILFSTVLTVALRVARILLLGDVRNSGIQRTENLDPRVEASWKREKEKYGNNLMP
jgi:hypothetical protein